MTAVLNGPTEVVDAATLTAVQVTTETALVPGDVGRVAVNMQTFTDVVDPYAGAAMAYVHPDTALRWARVLVTAALNAKTVARQAKQADAE